MSAITDYRERTLDQEPDAIALIPQHPNYIVVGTYHLHKAEGQSENEDKAEAPLRGGSLQILQFSTDPEQQELSLSSVRVDFSSAIVDLHFHPQDDTLLGAATSTGEIKLFRVDHIRTSTPASDQPLFEIVEIGTISISCAEDSSSVPVITYLDWLPTTISDRDAVNTKPSKVVVAVVCDTSGDSNLVRVTLPATHKTHDTLTQHSTSSTLLDVKIDQIHKQQHGLEAWFVTHLELQEIDSPESTTKHLILTGGDDGNLLASTCILTNTDHNLHSPPIPTFNMRKRHDAGVVSIVPLPRIDLADTTTTPILTGSYDDHLRLFLLEDSYLVSGTPPTLTTSINLNGGVWRILVMDHYTTPNHESKHWLLLICAMYDGAKIVRLTARPTLDPTSSSSSSSLQVTDQHHHEWTWTFTIEATFQTGHESMVYAAVFRRSCHQSDLWTIVTTSFYDRKVCEWKWRDRGKDGNLSSGPKGEDTC